MKNEIKRIAFNLDLPVDVVEKAYKSYWLFIKETIEKLPLEKDLSKEEFTKLKTSFNLPFLGKLYCNYDRLESIKNKDKNAKYKEN